MDEIELSVMTRGPQTAAILQPLLSQFEAQYRTHVRLNILSWDTARSELIKVALYHHGPDVSEIGSTWVSDLIALNALRLVPQEDLRTPENAAAFLPSSWENCRSANSESVLAVPWLAETMVLHYRTDLLEKAGIDPATAFQSFSNLQQTLESLRSAGHPLPMAIPARADHHMLLHAIASWIWGAGGDFISRDGKHILLTQPKALAGMTTFFSLLRFASAEGLRQLDQNGVVSAFRRGLAAIAISGPTLLLPHPDIIPEVNDHWGIAPIPAPAFVGGSNLVVWNHTHQEKTAFELVRFLTSTAGQAYYAPRAGMLPTRLEILGAPTYQDHPQLGVISQAARTGRTLSAVPLWGLIEDKVIYALEAVWLEYLSYPGLDLESTIHQIIYPLARRLEMTLGN